MKSVDLDLLKEIVEVSGLKQDELAQVFGVSRQTVHSWRSGKPAGNKYTVDRVDRMCRALKTVVAAGSLPLTFDIAPSARMSLIKIALTAALRK